MSEPDLERLSRLVLNEFKRLHQRLDVIEDAIETVPGFAKEIDHLL
jgi:tetrahydromethanopterin S-methyltransferase subunit G